MTNVPTWEQFMLPSLRLLEGGDVLRVRDICNGAADALGVDAEARREIIPSGMARYLNRAQWALSHLYQAGAVERPNRGQYRIADLGRSLMAQHPDGIRKRDLIATGWVPTQRGASSQSEESTNDEDSALSPDEQIEEGIARLHADVAADLLRRLHDREPAFFEQAVLDLIMAMGYGGADGKATRTQLSNDGGIDGVVDQDALGLSRVYVQAKRYELGATVGRPAIQAFVGALHGQQANQGVFFTTARYSTDAIRYAEGVSTRVVLIDGARLASLMIRYGVGVQTKRTVAIVEVDEDFFE